ncbi:hypothetical protein C8J56DRAFT_1130238 [Mycena floridula]|nr:hypothetical protein C8J56DRAFT_1130238 [Mycena floridula]
MTVFPSWFSVLLLWSSLCSASVIMVDDTLGDPSTGAQIVYSPRGSWGLGQDCTTCTATPNKTLTHDETWQDSTVINGATCNATLQFSGNAVAVYGIVAQGQFYPTVLTFFIDNVKQPGVYFNGNNDPSATQQYMYNIQFFSTTNLSSGSHQLVIQNGQAGGNSTVLLDYITYGLPDDPSSGPKKKAKLSTGGVIGISISIVAVLAILSILWFVFQQRRKQQQDQIPAATPFSLSAPRSPMNTRRSTGKSPPLLEAASSPSSETGATSNSSAIELQLLREALIRQWGMNTEGANGAREPPSYLASTM